MVAAASFGVALLPAPVSADLSHFNPQSQDGGNVSFCFTSSVTTYIRDNMTGVMNYMGSRLSAIPAVTYHASCDVAVGDGTPRTDIAWFDAWRDGVYGEAFCRYQWPNDGTSNQGECDQIHVYLVGEAIARDAPNDEHGYSSVACHEAGHTLGFKGHQSPPPANQLDCMAGGDIGTVRSTDVIYSNHNTADFNAYYD
ncbi:hypothetical protein [Micromonospora sp. NPDC049102]|uniref:hypothetical protein n=1 Tax=Micromonospora sp. NPDC049102 TaxID=3364265 RepID=UPI0037240751